MTQFKFIGGCIDGQVRELRHETEDYWSHQTINGESVSTHYQRLTYQFPQTQGSQGDVVLLNAMVRHDLRIEQTLEKLIEGYNP